MGRGLPGQSSRPSTRRARPRLQRPTDDSCARRSGISTGSFSAARRIRLTAEVVMAEYVLQTGKEGAARLDAVEGFFGTASRELLTEVGLRPGLRVLDVGCGTGTLTSWMARTVGKQGHVVAVDADAKQLDIARATAEKTGLSNVELRAGSPRRRPLAAGSVRRGPLSARAHARDRRRSGARRHGACRPSRRRARVRGDLRGQRLHLSPLRVNLTDERAVPHPRTIQRSGLRRG